MPSARSTLTALDSAKYYCTLSTYEYKRPAPMAVPRETPLRTFKLPLPRELNDNTSVDYATDQLQLTGDLLNNGAAGLLNTAGAEGLRQMGNLAGPYIQQGLGAITGSIPGMTQEAEQGMQAGVSPELVGSALQQYFGVAPNPNPSIAFKGPVLRELPFSWVLMASNREEAANIRALIKYLKRAHAPRSGSGSASILSYPHMVQMNFYPWDNGGGGKWGWGPNSIIKTKRCFIGSLNVEYTSGIAPAFFHDGNNEPVIVTITMTLKETEYFLNHDYGGDTRDLDILGQLGNLAALVGDLLVGAGGSADPINQQRDDDTRDASDL